MRLRDRSSACEVTTHNLTHSSFSSNHAYNLIHTLLETRRPTSQHTPRLLHHPRSHTFPIATALDTHANTQSHHVAVMKSIITFTKPRKSIIAASSMYASVPSSSGGRAIVSLLQPRYTARPSTFAALQRRPPRSLQYLRRKHTIAHITQFQLKSTHNLIHTISKPRRPTSQHTPRLLHHSRSHTFPIATALDTHANTQSHHVAIMKVIITFTIPYILIAASSIYASVPSSSGGHAIVSLLQPCYILPVLMFAALQRHPPPRRSSACEENTIN